MSKPRLLVVEDDAALASQYRWAFTDCRVLLAGDRGQALAIARREQPDAALLDLGLPPDAEGVAEGFATLAGLLAVCPTMPVIVASGQGQRENMLRAVAEGAYDFCEKPVDLAVLRMIIDRALRLRALEEENRRLALAPRASPIRDIITADEAMLKVCRSIERLAHVSVPVLLLGESGTGKEALARALHDMGPRARAQFVAINCAAIPEHLLESELFGHERGAFTGATRQVIGRIETAQGGTLFLDEIGDLPAGLQAKLLRFLQDGVIERVGGRAPIRVDARLVSATNQPLEKQSETGEFRADLLYPAQHADHPDPAAAGAGRGPAGARPLLPRPLRAGIRQQGAGPGWRGELGHHGACLSGQCPGIGQPAAPRRVDGGRPDPDAGRSGADRGYPPGPALYFSE